MAQCHPQRGCSIPLSLGYRDTLQKSLDDLQNADSNVIKDLPGTVTGGAVQTTASGLMEISMKQGEMRVWETAEKYCRL